jgi:uncharacterized protein YndB with AHSA1/START domain
MSENTLSQIVSNTSFTLPGGQRILRHEVTVRATLPEVWQAFTTSEGLRSFAAPIASIDLRIGGFWEAAYDLNGRLGEATNILNQVISYLPMEMLSIRIARTPPGFPHPEVTRDIWTVIQLKPEDERRVRVITSMVGWKDTPEHDVVYNLFKEGNAHTALWLYERFEKGPRQWA